MYERQVSPVLERFRTIYPVIGITGPRQSGKTTLAKTLFKDLPYVSFENIDIRLQANEDPRAFLKKYDQGAIFDEVQHTPDLLSYLQGVVDERPNKGRYVLTGSHHFSLSSSISQSLSGRIGMTTLLPLSLYELSALHDINLYIFQGGYPRLYQENMSPPEFYPSYIQTYIERDVRQLKNIEDFGKFQNFLKLCAGRIGQVINFSSLAQDCGISHTTAHRWLTVLEASYLIFFIQPYYRNFNKRLIKMPKLYFYDTGLACSLLGLETAKQLETHYMKGALFENSIILELLKQRFNKGYPANIYFWRDQTGHEIDCIAEWGGTLHAIEIKSSSTFQPNFIKPLQYFLLLMPEAKPSLIYNGEQEGSYSSINLIPWQLINKTF